MQAPVNVAKSSMASGLEAQPERHCVGQREPSFGVGVVDLDGLSVERTKDIAELVRIARRHVLGASGERVNLDGELLFAGGDGRRQHGRCAGHVRLHVEHAFVGLEREAARIEGDALADEHEAPTRAGRLPGKVNEPRLLVAPLRDGEVEPHPERGAGGAIEDLDESPACSAHSVATAARRVGVRTPAGSLTRSRARATARAVMRARASSAAASSGETTDGEQSVRDVSEGARVAIVGEIAIEAVGAEPGALGGRGQGCFGGARRPGQRCAHGSHRFGQPNGAAGGASERARVVVGRAQPDQSDATGRQRAVGVREQRLPGLRREPLLDDRATEEPIEAAVSAPDNSLPLAREVTLAATNHEEIDGLVERIPIGKGELEHQFGPRQKIGADGRDIKALTRC